MKKSFNQLYNEVFTIKNIEELRDYIVVKTDSLLQQVKNDKVLEKYFTNRVFPNLETQVRTIKNLFRDFLLKREDYSFANFIRILNKDLESLLDIFRPYQLKSSEYIEHMNYYRNIVNEIIAFVNNSIPPFFAVNDKIIENEDEQLRNNTINYGVYRLGSLLQQLYDLYYRTYTFSDDKNETQEERQENEAIRANIIFDLHRLNPLYGTDVVYNNGILAINTNIETPEEFRLFLNEINQFLNQNMDFIIADADYEKDIIEEIFAEMTEIINSITFI